MLCSFLIREGLSSNELVKNGTMYTSCLRLAKLWSVTNRTCLIVVVNFYKRTAFFPFMLFLKL